MKKLNLGCGTQVPDGWINVDYALGARLTKIPFFGAFNKKTKMFNLNWDNKIYIHNLTKKFPWAASSIDVVYTSHTLEHFTKEEGYRLLQECHRVLRKNGIIRIVVPDLESIVAGYMDGYIPADDFVEKLGVLYGFGHENNPIKKWLSPFFQFPHKCMYDSQRLIEILNEIGFDAKKRAVLDSDIQDIGNIELTWRANGSIIVEGIKR